MSFLFSLKVKPLHYTLQVTFSIYCFNTNPSLCLQIRCQSMNQLDASKTRKVTARCQITTQISDSSSTGTTWTLQSASAHSLPEIKATSTSQFNFTENAGPLQTLQRLITSIIHKKIWRNAGRVWELPLQTMFIDSNRWVYSSFF